MPANEDKDLETHSENVEFSSKEKGAMTDAHYASELIKETYPTSAVRNVQAAIGDAFEALKRRERKLPAEVLRERHRKWTERRVRALWFREARRVDHYEIQDLTAIAVEEARIERQRLKAREERLTAILAAAEASENSSSNYQSGRAVRGVDLPGVGFTDADDRSDQSQEWGH